MESWFKAIAALLAGGLALYWHPGLETAQNLVTSAAHISGQAVVLIWLFLSFVWAFIGVLLGHSLSATLLFYLPNKNWQPTRGSSARRHH